MTDLLYVVWLWLLMVSWVAGWVRYLVVLVLVLLVALLVPKMNSVVWRK